MEENIKMQFFGYNEGKIACIRGRIYRVNGILVGGLTQYDNEVKSFKDITLRIPLIGNELKPYSLITGDGDNVFNIICEPKEFTINHLKMILSLQKEWNTYHSLIDTLSDLRDNGFTSFNIESRCIEVKVNKGVFTLNDVVIGNENLIYELAKLREYSYLNFYNFISDGSKESEEIINLIEKSLVNIYNHGLYRTQNLEGTDYIYYDGVFLYSGDMSLIGQMNFFDFDKKYPKMKRIVKSLMGI